MATTDRIPDDALTALPDPLAEAVREALADWPADEALPDDPEVLRTLPRAWACSEFITRSCQRCPQRLRDLAESGDLTRRYAADELRDNLATALSEVRDEPGLHLALRRFRNREILRIAWRDLVGWADLEETLRDLSELAEACIDLPLDILYHWLCERMGTPRDGDGNQQRMVVLGMGKLGGQELNFSSDIDLIFCFPESGETDGRRPRDNQEFFIRLGRQLITALDKHTPDGQVFRVDMRLRPNGDSGPLALSFAAMEHYYQHQGREWERYAMIKARVVGGDYQAGEALLADLRPFVYRRYLDFGALEELRGMKAKVMAQVRLKGMEDNLKLGPGGIREVEFIGQAFQLIRGGRDRRLQERRILHVLDYLREIHLLPDYVVSELTEGYRFLREAENRLQAIGDRQTHEIPDNPLDRQRLALAMGFDDWAAFQSRLDRVQHQVHGHFEQVFAAPQAESDEGSEPSALDVLWLGELEPETVRGQLGELGFDDAQAVERRLRTLRESSVARALSRQGRHRLDRLIPLLIGAACNADQPDLALIRSLDLVETIARRTAYLSLLVEHPMALSQLIQLCDGSAWIARYLAHHPLLLDELLDPRSLYKPLGREALAEELREWLRPIEEHDLEEQMEALRLFKQTNTLRVAAADISGAVPVMVVSDYLTGIAEVVLEEAVGVVYRHLVARHGRPLCRMDGETVEAGFAVIAYGKLGSIELGYGSDLDLVFIHDTRGEAQQTDGPRPLDNPVFFARLTQRLIHVLNTQTPGGVLYEVDTRLRPSGKAGLLATSLEAFARYQREEAWTWEHQALVRARAVAGCQALCRAFETLREELLCQPRAPEPLREEVRNMRERMRDEKASRDPGLFDIKQDRGGITDIEFMVQYAVLAAAHEHPELIRYPDNVRLLGALGRCGWLPNGDADRLAEAYRAYRGRLHRLTLQEAGGSVPAEEFQQHRETVTAIWERLMGGD
ncbi:bifunctional [glutamate--ammonia ligase]-adenylyl-L-tyrosine phosphorylase/[glutamate--ammonia-ligase] adenylyltransferase [Alkalilimnicola ehrlichii MLHE-1]|uniref:Bifunctional glutamine synthetase adenylyltransferase/adenylyl-removing enzyme n=1 Tax=Alkalilimnicola ehrlichii (strain ATCC BAA-1101 / DSM 17681 / MLHE-1) TaxID=187272 RepID=Q0A549_ALKEH|nr:bifunctional [glutamate--ammonia ligase]-adenylyl-L-tyrosine phosphorylase/[glutamate--ammonia-ligase] adenylyltransferase [Alkalilimnicola ehrlichii]ABI58038.1 (Glutamate--ammonia-ligase) adenylyltransferase [Alkalilimnicola ehrlichii MLHE-1]